MIADAKARLSSVVRETPAGTLRPGPEDVLHDSLDRRVRAFIIRWARYWHLNAPWVYDQAGVGYVSERTRRAAAMGAVCEHPSGIPA